MLTNTKMQFLFVITKFKHIAKHCNLTIICQA